MSLEERLLPPQTKPHASIARVPEAWYVVADARALQKKPLPIVLLVPRGGTLHPAVLGAPPGHMRRRPTLLFLFL